MGPLDQVEGKVGLGAIFADHRSRNWIDVSVPAEVLLRFWKSPPRFPMGALPPNPAEGFVRVDVSTLSQIV